MVGESSICIVGDGGSTAADNEAAALLNGLNVEEAPVMSSEGVDVAVEAVVAAAAVDAKLAGLSGSGAAGMALLTAS